MKTVIYYCPHCRHRMQRIVKRRYKELESYCETIGKPVIIRAIKDQTAALRDFDMDRY